MKSTITNNWLNANSKQHCFFQWFVTFQIILTRLMNGLTDHLSGEIETAVWADYELKCDLHSFECHTQLAGDLSGLFLIFHHLSELILT